MREVTNATLEFLVLALRISMIFLLYFFLFQVVRIVGRELRVLGSTAAASGGSGAAAASAYGRLSIISPGQTGLPGGKEFALGPVNTIGRRPDNDIVLNDSFISTEHALLEWRGDSWWLEDLGSTNGSFINDIEVTAPTPVSYGDVIRIGRVELKLSR
ncbi:MAG: FHA domain-containing protein [Herpetosiphonaceae bacterium]|nr:MAG: FHA domain-containing protein [Herpetosiphonaceae bacterium]